MTSKHAFLLSTFVGAVGMLTACSSDRKVSASPPEIVRNVAVTTAHTANVPDLLEAVGTVHAAQTSELASQVMGTIVEVRVREGDSVRRGQVLVIIDDRESIAAVIRATAGETAAQQEVAAAESELALAESTLKRYQNLFEKKSVSPQEFDEVKTRQQAALAHKDLARASLEQAKAALAQARTALEYTQVRAPFDGVVTERKLDPGAMANPGSPVLAIEDTSRYRLEVAINENDLWQRAFLKISEVLVQRNDVGTYILGVCREWLEAATVGIIRNIVLPCDARILQLIENGSHVHFCDWLGYESC